MALLSWLSNRLFGGEPAPAPPGRARLAPPAAVADEPARPSGLFQRAVRERLIATGGRGHVQILNLSSLATRYGQRWPLVADKVEQLVALTLNRRLSPDDSFTRCDDTTYLIIFQRLSAGEAKVKCALLAEEILGKLLGQGEAPGGFEVATATLDPDGAVEVSPYTKQEALGLLVDEQEQAGNPVAPGGDRGQALRRLIEQAAAEFPEPAPPVSAACVPHSAAMRQRLMETAQLEAHGAPRLDGLAASHLGARDSDEWETAFDPAIRLAAVDHDGQGGALVQPGGPIMAGVADIGRDSGWPPGAVGDGRAGIESLSDDITRVVRRAERELAAQSRLRDGLFTAGSLDLAQVVFKFQPLLLASGQVAAHECQAGLEVEGNAFFGNDFLPTDASRDLVSVVDRLVLRKAIAELREPRDWPGNAAMLIPVHHATLMRLKSRTEFTTLCNLVEHECRRHILWEIVDPALGFTNAHLPPAVALLRKYGRAVLVRVALDQPNLQDMVGIGVHGVSVDVNAAVGGSEQPVARRIGLFAARAKRYHLRTYLAGLETRTQLSAAQQASIDYMAGPAAALLGENSNVVGMPAASHVA